jgi:cell division septal protein FtsQ
MGSKRVRRVKIALWLMLAGLVAIGIRATLLSDLFAIRRLVVKADSSLEADIREAFCEYCNQNHLGVWPNLFVLDRRSLARFLLSDLRIKKVKIRRMPPGSLIIEAEEREPFCWIKRGLGVGKDGVVFPIKEGDEFPLLYGFEDAEEGDKIDVEVLYSIIKRMENFHITEIREGKQKFFFLIESVWICILPEEDLRRQIKRLEKILKEVDLSKFKLIDMSYDDVVLSPEAPF